MTKIIIYYCENKRKHYSFASDLWNIQYYATCNLCVYTVCIVVMVWTDLRKQSFNPLQVEQVNLIYICLHRFSFLNSFHSSPG